MGFLIRAAEYLDRQGIEPTVAFESCLAGIDNDAWAIKHAEALIELYLAAHQVALPGPKPRLLCRDSLLTDAGALRHEIGFPEGFDVVVTNPPYVKLQNGFAFESLADADVNRETLAASTFSMIPYDQLNAKKWRLAKGRHFDHLLAIEANGVPLGDMADIKVGFATLKDAVFFAWKENGHCISETSNGDTHPIESEATRPAVKIADIETQSDLSQNTRRIIFPYRKQCKTYQLIPEGHFRTEFPSTYEYLQAHRETLAGRDKGRKRYKNWYAWGRTQGREADGPKLLTKTFSEPRFFLYESDQLFCNGYAITLKEQSLFGSPLPLEALQRILNSTLMHYYAKLTSFQIEGNYQ